MSAEICIEALADGEDFSYQLTRTKFEEINANHFAKIVPIIDKCLADADLTKHQIHDVVMVGGSTRIPKIRELVQGYFQGKNLDHTINPDEAVARGAAIVAS